MCGGRPRTRAAADAQAQTQPTLLARTTYKTMCPFRITIRRQGDIYRLSNVLLAHNHPLSSKAGLIDVEARVARVPDAATHQERFNNVVSVCNTICRLADADARLLAPATRLLESTLAAAQSLRAVVGGVPADVAGAALETVTNELRQQRHVEQQQAREHEQQAQQRQQQHRQVSVASASGAAPARPAESLVQQDDHGAGEVLQHALPDAQDIGASDALAMVGLRPDAADHDGAGVATEGAALLAGHGAAHDKRPRAEAAGGGRAAQRHHHVAS